MDGESKLSAIVGSIYDAAVNPEYWSAALDPIAVEVGAKGSVIFAVSDAHATPFSVVSYSSLFDAGAIAKLYRDWEKYVGDWWKSYLNMPAGTFITDEMVWTDRDAFNVRPDVLWAIQTKGYYNRTAMILSYDKAWFDAIVFQYAVGRGNATRAERTVAKLYQPHLAKAIEVSRGLSVLRRRFHAALAALDRWHVGHVLVRADGGILYANDSAKRIFEARDGVENGHDGVLRATFVHLDDRLKRAVADVAATADEAGATAGVFLKVPKRSGGGDYALEVAPVRDADGEIDRAFRGAWVTIVDPDRREHFNLTGMAALYDLTPAESEVLTLLMDGLRTNEIADHRSVSLGATRQQIKSILAKTDCHDRTDLVRRVFTVNLPIDPTDTSV
ncbi:MAG: helix-turn-helix transcriptional regulator [Alphaproteobacteria bacterium]|nr:helix-turn-helix transcriptional regulator [Alphaproteobacteria bacterium]